MLSILNELTLSKKKFITNNVLWTKHTTTTKHKSNHKNYVRSRELNPGLLAYESNALPLGQRENCKLRLE